MSPFSLLKYVRGIVKLKGDTDGSKIGNVDDSIKSHVTNDNTAPIPVKPRVSNQTAFGDPIAEHLEPISQISATYGINGDTEVFNETGGTVTEADNMYQLSTGTSLGGYGVLRTKRPTVYREGQGLMSRFTAIFDGAAVANSLQFAGFFNLTDTIAFGYRGTSFGIIYDTYGAPEIQNFTITTSGNGTVTLTLNSIVYNIPITTGTVQHNAYEMADWLNANQSAWNAQQEDDMVVLQARATETRNGTYSTAGAGLVGNFSQLEAGAAKTEVSISQAGWNKDIASWFDPTESNVYMIKMSYLGFGPLRFFIFNHEISDFVLVHEIIPAGTAVKPSISKRSLKVGWVAASLGSTTDLIVKGASAATFIEGESKIFGQANSTANINLSVGAVFTSVLSIRTKEVYKDKVMLGRIVPIGIAIASDATKSTQFSVIKNANFGETDYQSYSSDSIAQFDISSGTIVGNPTESFAGVLSPAGSAFIDLTDLDIELELNETLTLFARKTSGTNPEITASIVWKEDF